MKKLSFWLFSFLFILLASCKYSFSDNFNIAYITLYVDEERTVLPPYSSVSEMTDFVLSGKHNGITRVLGEFDTVSQVRNSNIIIEKIGIWDFSLTAVKGNNSFISNINSYNVTSGNNSLTFNLAIVEDQINSQDGNGSIYIGITLPDGNNVHHAKAGLFSVNTDSAVNGFEPVSIRNYNKSISYSQQNVPAGSYRFKVYFYADENETLLLNTYKEIILVAASCTSSKNITIKNLNKVYSVTYNTNGAGEVASKSFTKFSDDIILPDVTKQGYSFEGWYTEPTFDNKVTTIPANSGKDFSMYASWGITVTPDSVNSFAENAALLTSYAIVRYVGKLSDEHLSILSDNLPENIVLDLSAATGRNSITYKSYSTGDYISYFSTCKSVILPNCLTNIGRNAFYGCSSLQEITIPDDVTSIGWDAFYGCSSLQEITIPDAVTSIGDFAFYGCSSLQEITIPDDVTSIGSSTFYGCSSLQEITIPDGVTCIDSRAFYGCNSLQEIAIPDGVISIGDSAFSHCISLQEITIPDGVTSIGNSAFSDCSSLTDIIIPDNVSSIGMSAFEGCTLLIKVFIPESVTSIKEFTFGSCISLSEITIPSTVISIKGWAFHNCSNLKTIHFAGTKSQWKSDEWNSYFPTGAKIYCTDGNITL